MTWSEFKAVVESAGIRDDDEIDYIDFSDHGAPPHLLVVSETAPRQVVIE